MAQVIRQGMLVIFLGLEPNMKGNDVANEVADCVAGKANSSMLLLLSSVSAFTSGGFRDQWRDLLSTKSKCPFDLVIRCLFAHLINVITKCSPLTTVDELAIREDKCLLHVKADCYNIHGVCEGKLVALLLG